MEKVLNEKYSAEYNEALKGMLKDFRGLYYGMSTELLNIAVKGPLKKWDEGFSIGDICKSLPLDEMDNCDDPYVRKIRQILKSMFELIRDADMLDEDEDEEKTARVAVLYRDDNPKAARSIWASIVDGKMTMELQDIGPLVEDSYGDSDYERTISGISAAHVGLELGATNEDELMQKLIEEFGTNDGFDRFDDFLTEAGIEHEHFAYA